MKKIINKAEKQIEQSYRKIEKYENTIRNNKYETLAVFDSKG